LVLAGERERDARMTFGAANLGKRFVAMIASQSLASPSCCAFGR
jgi:hypothetical protein